MHVDHMSIRIFKFNWDFTLVKGIYSN